MKANIQRTWRLLLGYAGWILFICSLLLPAAGHVNGFDAAFLTGFKGFLLLGSDPLKALPFFVFMITNFALLLAPSFIEQRGTPLARNAAITLWGAGAMAWSLLLWADEPLRIGYFFWSASHWMIACSLTGASQVSKEDSPSPRARAGASEK